MDENNITSSPLSSPPDSIFNDDPQDESVQPSPTTEGGLAIFEQMLKFEEEKKREAEAQAEAVRKMKTEARSNAIKAGIARKRAQQLADGPKDQQEGDGTIICRDPDEGDDDDEPEIKRRKVAEAPKPLPKIILHVTPTTETKPAPSARKSAKDKKWEAPFVYTDEKSPLVNVDLRSMLLLPGAWDILTQDEKKDILAKFPDETHILDAGTPNARPNIESLRNDDDFRHDTARYVENLELGRHDEDWLYQAWVAHEKHKRGDFNAFVNKKVEEEWDVELPKAEGDQGSSSGDANSSSSSPTSVKSVKVENGDASTNDATSAPKTDTDTLPTDHHGPISVVIKAKVVAEDSAAEIKPKVVVEDSATEIKDEPATMPEVAKNGN